MESNWQNILSINTYLKLDSAHGSINITRVSSSGPDESTVLGLSSTGNVTSLSPIIDHTAVYPLPNNLFNPPLIIIFFFLFHFKRIGEEKKKLLDSHPEKWDADEKFLLKNGVALFTMFPIVTYARTAVYQKSNFFLRRRQSKGKKMNKNVTLLQYQDPQSFLCGSRNFPLLFFLIAWFIEVVVKRDGSPIVRPVG